MAIVFKDLQNLVSQSQQENTRRELFQRLQGKPFWIWNIKEHKQEEMASRQQSMPIHLSMATRQVPFQGIT